jgi:hypothetical protein
VPPPLPSAPDPEPSAETPRTDRVDYLDFVPLSPRERSAAESQVQGSWQLDGFSMLNRTTQVRTVGGARPPSPGEHPETWTFRAAGQFEHDKRGGPAFSGRYAITHRVKRVTGLGLDAATSALYWMHNTAIQSTTGSAWAGDDYLIEIAVGSREVTFYYLGRQIPAEPPPALGSRFVRFTK